MAKKVTLRFDLKSAGLRAYISIHKQTYKLELNKVSDESLATTYYFPRSITEIIEFHKDKTNNHFLEFLDVEIDKWFAEKEGYTDLEFVTVVSEY